MAKRDYYEILGVTRDISPTGVKRAYFRLARMYHPDMNKSNPQAEVKFKEINEAYKILSDPDKRRRYDTFYDSSSPLWRFFRQLFRKTLRAYWRGYYSS
jgi:DnaJ-class molecular chaperone